jgi:hypothetical protein
MISQANVMSEVFFWRGVKLPRRFLGVRGAGKNNVVRLPLEIATPLLSFAHGTYAVMPIFLIVRNCISMINYFSSWQRRSVFFISKNEMTMIWSLPLEERSQQTSTIGQLSVNGGECDAQWKSWWFSAVSAAKEDRGACRIAVNRRVRHARPRRLQNRGSHQGP